MVDGTMATLGTLVMIAAWATRGLADQQVIGRNLAIGARNAEAGRGIALRIEIDDQHALADGGQRRGEIDRGGGLAHAALLVGESQDTGRQIGLQVVCR